MNSKTSFFFFLILIVTTGEAHERGKGSLQDVKQLSEAARKKISDLLIDKDEGGEGKERLLWEKMLLTIIKFACFTSQTPRQANNLLIFKHDFHILLPLQFQ